MIELPTTILFATPIPPDTCTDPVVYEVESPVPYTTTDLPT